MVNPKSWRRWKSGWVRVLSVVGVLCFSLFPSLKWTLEASLFDCQPLFQCAAFSSSCCLLNQFRFPNHSDVARIVVLRRYDKVVETSGGVKFLYALVAGKASPKVLLHLCRQILAILTEVFFAPLKLRSLFLFHVHVVLLWLLWSSNRSPYDWS